MKAKQSPLKLRDFTVFRSHVDFVSTENPKTVNLYDLPINIDFEIFEPDESGSLLRLVEMVLSVNKSGRKPGYKIDIRVSGVFEVENTGKLPDSTIHNLLGISTISLAISNIRGYLKNITAYGAYGSYLLPSIDINQLLDSKISKE